MLSKVNIQPGIDKQTTTYGAEGRWIDAKNVRFRAQLPEKMGGWSKLVSTRVIGVVRSMKAWYSSGGVRFLAIGTERKLYIFSEGVISDITPVRATATLNGPFTSTGNATVTVVHTSHGATLGDFVTYSGAAVVGGQDLNNEYEITTIIDANVTTLIASLVLYQFGTGPIKGFATTLVIGILTSLFAAIFITRLVISARLNKGKSISFSTKLTKGAFKNLNIDFIGKRKVFYVLSAIVILFGGV